MADVNAKISPVPTTVHFKLITMWRRSASMLQEINLIAQHFPKKEGRKNAVELRNSGLRLVAVLSKAVKSASKENVKKILLAVDDHIQKIEGQFDNLRKAKLIDQTVVAQAVGDLNRIKEDSKYCMNTLRGLST